MEKQSVAVGFLSSLAILVFGLFVAAIVGTAPKAQADEGPADVDVNSYLVEAADEGRAGTLEEPGFLAKLFGVEAHMEPSGHALVVKHTLIDADKSDGAETIDSLFADEEGVLDKLVSVNMSAATVYEIGPDADCYVAFVSPAVFTQACQAPIDWLAAVADTSGTTVEGVEVDVQAGIAYIDKGLYDREDVSAVGLEVQLLELYSWEDAVTPVAVHVDNARGDVRLAEGGRGVMADALGTDIVIPLVEPSDAARIDVSDISVSVNGSNFDLAANTDDEGNRVSAAYDQATGELTIAGSGVATASVEVEIAGGTGANRAYAYDTPSSMSAVSGFKFTNMDLDDVVVGDRFDFDTSTLYEDSSGFSNAIRNYMFDNYLYSYGGGALDWHANDIGRWMYSGSVSGNEQYYYLEPGSSADCPIEIAMPRTALTSTGGRTVDFSYDATLWSSRGWSDYVALFCCHVDLTGSGNHGPGTKRASARVLAKGSDYVVLGLISSQTYTQSGFGAYKFAVESKGNVAVAKSSANASITDGNACYSLAGARYNLVNPSTGAVVASGTTNAAGAVTITDVRAGTYTLVEAAASTGYAVTNTNYPSAGNKSVTVRGGQTTSVSVLEYPMDDPDRMRVGKVDADSQTHTGRVENLPEGSASLEGAEFTFRYYAGYYDESNLPAVPTRTWVMRTNASGVVRIFAGESMKVSGDEFYYDALGNITLPLGTITAIETKAPEGYLLGTPYLYVSRIVAGANRGVVEPVNYDSANTINTEYNTPKNPEQVIRGGVKVAKKDRQHDGYVEQGAATLSGARFEIVNKSAESVIVDGATYPSDAVVKTIYSEYDAATGAFVAQTDADALPYGSYTVYEAEACTGYFYDAAAAAWHIDFDIREDGVVLDFANVGQACPNLVKRGDVSFYKYRDGSTRPVAEVPFRITSATTGEAHVVVTDENGYFDTSAGWNAHTAGTNGNDAAVSAAGAVDDAALDAARGVWFSGRADRTVAPDDALGALPYDTYRIEELPCAANSGSNLIRFDVTVTRHGVTLAAPTVNDNFAAVATVLATAGGSKMVPDGTEADLIDTVTYANLEDGAHYKLVGKLHKVDASGNDEGEVATGTAEFTAHAAALPVEVPFYVEPENMGGGKYVCFEYLYDSDGNLVASEEDIGNAEQTVGVTAIGTVLADGSGAKMIPCATSATLVDTVRYANLVPNRRYVMTTTLHLKNPDGTDAGAVYLANGDSSVSTAFTPTEPSGTVTVAFDIEADDVNGTLVAFEELRLAGEVVGTHQDIGDEAQTVRVPSVATMARDSETGTQAGTVYGHIVDTARYTGLVEGEAYALTATLHRRAADGTDAGEVASSAGASITATKQFTADESTGYVQVDLPDAGEDLAGQTIVVFEQLRALDGTLLCTEEDIANDDQAVSYARIGTTAHVPDGTGQVLYAAPEATVQDTVRYEGVAPGAYTVVATLHALDGDGNDLGAYARTKGDVVTASKALEVGGAADGTGETEMALTFDASNLSGKKFVVFEQLVDNQSGIVLAAHEDPRDEGQTVSVAGIGTKASDRESGEHAGETRKAPIVDDLIVYEGLAPGRSYKAKATLIDRSTGDAAELSAPAETTFVPEGPSGSASVAVRIAEGVDVDGKTFVVFEELYDDEGNLVADHKDIESADQSVAYREASATGYDKTGAEGPPWVPLTAGTGAFAAGLFALRQYREANKRYWPVETVE